MPGHRKNYSNDLKAKVALEAIRGQKTANEIAAEYGIHPTQIAQWKKQALDGLIIIVFRPGEQGGQVDPGNLLPCLRSKGKEPVSYEDAGSFPSQKRLSPVLN